MSHKRKIRVFPLNLILLGLLGLFLSILGELTNLGEYPSFSPREWEQFDPNLVTELPNIIAMKNKIDQSLTESLTDQDKMLVIYDVVIHRFTHGDQSKYNIFSNWLLWLAGKVAPPLSFVRSPDILVENGHSALCGVQAYVLQSLAESYGIPTRRVGMNGHVVMEAWYENDWHLYDPDLEVIPITADENILSLNELARSPELIRKHYKGSGSKEYIESIVEIVSSREDNSFILYWTIEKRMAYRFERFANVAKWIIPSILLLTGLGVYFRKNRKIYGMP